MQTLSLKDLQRASVIKRSPSTAITFQIEVAKSAAALKVGEALEFAPEEWVKMNGHKPSSSPKRYLTQLGKSKGMELEVRLTSEGNFIVGRIS